MNDQVCVIVCVCVCVWLCVCVCVCVCVCEPASIANQQPVVPDPVAQQCFPEPKLTMRCTSTTSIIIGSITTTRASQVPPTSAISCNSNSELTPPDTPPRPLETQFLHDHVLQLLDNLSASASVK